MGVRSRALSFCARTVDGLTSEGGIFDRLPIAN